jgi:hypothetical protein
MVLSILNKAAIALGANRIAQVAASPEAFADRVMTAYSAPETIEFYYRKFGSTERKFDYHPYPRLYVGYIKVPDKDEFLSVVFLNPDGGSAVASYWPDFTYGQDLLGLMGKKAFADQITSTYIENARRIGYVPPSPAK